MTRAKDISKLVSDTNKTLIGLADQFRLTAQTN